MLKSDLPGEGARMLDLLNAGGLNGTNHELGGMRDDPNRRTFAPGLSGLALGRSVTRRRLQRRPPKA
jgi:hypothetical protein